MAITQLMTCPVGYRAVYSCGEYGTFVTKPVAALALVDFGDAQDICGVVVGDSYDFIPRAFPSRDY